LLERREPGCGDLDLLVRLAACPMFGLEGCFGGY